MLAKRVEEIECQLTKWPRFARFSTRSIRSVPAVGRRAREELLWRLTNNEINKQFCEGRTMDLTFTDIKRLSELLKPEEVSSDSDDDLPRVGLARFGPGDIAGKKPSDNAPEDEAAGKKVDTKAIWDEREIPDGVEFDESEDPRERPNYEIKYRQAVATEDMFLQMGGKTPLSSSCEDLVIEIKLDKEEENNVDLHVIKQVLELRSEKYRLSLPLPHPVDPDSAKALWEPSSRVLTVTLRMRRELDFINF